MFKFDLFWLDQPRAYSIRLDELSSLSKHDRYLTHLIKQTTQERLQLGQCWVELIIWSISLQTVWFICTPMLACAEREDALIWIFLILCLAICRHNFLVAVSIYLVGYWRVATVIKLIQTLVSSLSLLLNFKSVQNQLFSV